MARRNKSKSIKTTLKNFGLLPVFMALAATLIIAPLAVLYVVYGDTSFLIIAAISLFFLLLGYIFLVAYVSKLVKVIFYDQIYEKTLLISKKLQKTIPNLNAMMMRI